MSKVLTELQTVKNRTQFNKLKMVELKAVLSEHE